MSKKPYHYDLSINSNRIDLEILAQPQKYYEVAYLAAEAENLRDEIKDNLEVVNTAVENRLRKDWEKYFETPNGKAPTEAAIKTKVASDVAVRKLRRELTEAANKARLLKKAELAFVQRKDMIEAHLKYILKIIDSEVMVPKAEVKVPSSDTENLGRELRRQMNRGKK